MAFLGMRGNGDWVTDQRPKNWREAILYRYPNGSAPLTAILSKMGSEKTDDPEFNWWTKSLATQQATVTGVYTNASLDTAYVSGGVAGDTLYVKMSAADRAQVRSGHTVQLRDASEVTNVVVGLVTSAVTNGASSYVAVKLLEADDNGTGVSKDLSDCDGLLVIGNANAEGGAMPDSIAYDPTKWYNFTQIFRTSLSITRTAMQTRLRTGDQYKEAKREALELHSIEMEKAFLYGVSYEGTGDNGKPLRTTLGIIPAIKGGYTGEGTPAGTVNDYTTNATFHNTTWLNGGETWIDTELEAIFRNGSTDKLALCGSGALLGIQKLIKANGNFDFTSATESYGIKVTKWVTAFGTINIMTHPLFNNDALMRNSMLILEPKDIKYRYIQDTTFKADKSYKDGGWTNRDGLDEEYLTECGLEYHHPDGWGLLTGFNTDHGA